MDRLLMGKWNFERYYLPICEILDKYLDNLILIPKYIESSYAEENEFSVLNEWMDNQKQSLFFRVV